MKSFIALIVLALSAVLAGYAQNVDSVLSELDRIIERRDTHFMAHEHTIDSLKRTLMSIPQSDAKGRADVYHRIFDLYKSYQGDSARVYAEREARAARVTGDCDRVVRSQSDRLYSYITGGLFSDAVDVVRETDLSEVSDSMKGLFYFRCIRLYSDMSNYSDGTWSDKNSFLSKAYGDSVIACLPPDAYEAQYAGIFKTLSDRTPDQKIETFERLLRRADIDAGEKAMIASIIADFYTEKGDKEMCAFYKAQSAILDIKSAKRETTSKRDLARIIFELGDVERANKYIKLALEDANFFNARHRKCEISSVMPLIEHSRYMIVDKERSTLMWITVVMVLIVLSLVISLVYNVRQKRRLDASRRVIEERNREVEAANHNLEELNTQLTSAYDRLAESTRIKDEYIGYGFHANSEYIQKMESLYKLVKRKLNAHQYEDLKMSLKDSDIRKEKEGMQRNFDRVFLRLFPTFIDEYKALFPDDDVTFAEINRNTLTPEMRIFALIRLGISDCGEIASFLNYSVNTVNTYKTKAKNRSTVQNDQFESRIMSIRSIS